MNRSARWVAGLFLATAATANAQAGIPEVRAGPTSVAAHADTVFRQWQHTDGPGCTVGAEWNGERTTRAYGMANLEYGLALHPESVVESGSVAKQFTAATLILLAQRGKLSLDDDIRRYLPEVPDFGTPITIRHLLHHTSGLRDQWGLLGFQGFPPGREVHTFARILDLVSRQRRLNFAPGSEYLYSNTGYSLSAVIVARVTGMSFAEFSRKELFEPLGMHATRWRDDYRRVVPHRATAYAPDRAGWVQDMPFTMVHGNGGLLTTVGDLLTWNAALEAGSVPGGAELVRTLETRGRLTGGAEISYALGVQVDEDRGMRRVSHGGATAGYRTYLARWPGRGLSIAVLCNAASANPARHVQELAYRLLGIPDEEPPPSAPVPITAAELAPLAGQYRDSVSDQIIGFDVRDGALVTGPGGVGRLVHLGNLRFWHPQAGEYQFAAGATPRVRPGSPGSRELERLTPVDANAVRLADYVGRYRSPELDVVVDVEVSEGQLVVRRRPADRLTLRPIYRDGFTAGNQTYRFERSRERVTGFQVFAGRVRHLQFERVP